MGVTIECKKTGSFCDITCGGFFRFRNKVATLSSEEFGEHYSQILTKLSADKKARDAFDRETERLIRKCKISRYVDGFLFQSDCSGRITPAACKKIYDIIKDYNDSETNYSYAAKMVSFNDLKALIKECCDKKSCMEWR